MIGSLLAASLLLTSSVPAADNTPLTDRVVLNQKLQELLDKRAELENKKKEIIEEESQRILNRDLVEEKYTAFKNALNELSNKKQELINKEREFTKAFASVLDKMNAGGGDYVLLRFETLVNGVGEEGGDFYRSEFSPAPGSEGSGGFARRTGTDYTIGADLSSLLYTSGNFVPFLKDKPHFSHNNVSKNKSGIHVNFPCEIYQNYRLESGNGLTPIFSIEAYEQCDIVGLQKADLSSGKYGLGVNFEGQTQAVLGTQLGEMTNYRMSITARKPYFKELETKRQELNRLLRLKTHLKEEVKTKSAEAIEAVKKLQLSDDIAQPEQIQELVERISKTF